MKENKDGNEEKCLNFRGTKIKNNNVRYEFDAHRKPALTNLHITPHSCIPSVTIISRFKGFLAKATKICSEKYLTAEMKYMTDMFCENGYDLKILKKIINNSEKKTRSINNTNNNNNNTDKKQTITLPWIPKIGRRIKTKFKSLVLE